MFNSEKEQILVNIECCQNCSFHSWFTHHQEEKYEYYFNEIKHLIEKDIENVKVEKNSIPNYLVKLENKFQEDQSQFLDLLLNKSVQYPRVGSFEISIFNVTIFSKITTSTWPHFSSIMNTLKCIIFDKSQKKVVLNYSVLRSDTNQQQGSRDIQLQNTSCRIPIVQPVSGISRKSGSSSPRPHNGVRMPPLSIQSARSNSPQLRNFITPIETRNYNEETQQQCQQITIPISRDKAQSPQKILPPLIDKQMDQFEPQKQPVQITKTNFYTTQGQEESYKSSLNYNGQKIRSSSPQSNYYAGRFSKQQNSQNIRNQTQDTAISAIGINENDQFNKNNSSPFFDKKGKQPLISKVANTSKVRFDYIPENEKSEEKDQQQVISNNVSLKTIAYNQRQKDDQSSPLIICDMKIKTVKLPYRNIYTSLKKNQNLSKHSHGVDSNDSQTNQHQINSLLTKNKYIPINSNMKTNAKLQNQKNVNNIHQIQESGIQEEHSKSSLQKEKGNIQRISPRSPIAKFKKGENQSDQNQINSPSTEQNNNENKQAKKQEGLKSSLFMKEKQKSEQENHLSLSQSLKESNANLSNKPELDLKQLYKKLSSDRIEKQKEQANGGQNLGLDSLQETLENLSKIEVIKSEVSSSTSLFSSQPHDKQNKGEDVSNLNMEDSQAKRKDSQSKNMSQDTILQQNKQSSQNYDDQSNDKDNDFKQNISVDKDDNHDVKSVNDSQQDSQSDLNIEQDEEEPDLDIQLIKSVVTNYLIELKINSISQLIILKNPISNDDSLSYEQKNIIKQNTSKIHINHSYLNASSQIKNKEQMLENSIKLKYSPSLKQQEMGSIHKENSIIQEVDN